MTIKKVKASDILGDNYYTYDLTSSSYTPNLNSSITITCTVKNIYGDIITNKSVQLYQNDVAVGNAKTTNNNGVVTWTITCSTAGVQKFSIKDNIIEVFVDTTSKTGHNHTTSDITNFPTIPTKTSDLTDDIGFLTEHNPIDSQLSSTSTNAVQNKVVNTAINNMGQGLNAVYEGAQNYTNGVLGGYVSKNDIQNDLTSTDVLKVLSANQGKELKTLIDGKASSSHSHGNITNDGKLGSTANKPLMTTNNGLISLGSFGNSANSFCEGNDSRLSDSRTPKAHTHITSEITNFPTLSNIATTGNYNDLNNLPTIPTKTSDLTNDSNFLSQHQDITGKEDKSNKITSWSNTSSDTKYPSEKLVKDELDNKANSSDIPTNNNQLVNGAGYITSSTLVSHNTSDAAHSDIRNILNNKASSSDIPTKTSDLTNDSGYLTEHQSLNNYIQKSSTNGLVKNDGTIDTNSYLTTSNASSTYVAKETGKGLSSNDYTTNEKNKLNGIESSANNYTHPSTHSSSMITDSNTHTNIGNTNNTLENILTNIDSKLGSLANVDLIEVITSLPTASASTMNKLYLIAESSSATNDNYEIYVTVKTGTNGNYTYAWEKVDTARIDLSNYLTTTNAQQTYVAKETGKGLSSNDYTTTEKNKLANLHTVATTGNYNNLNNKPSIPTVDNELTQNGNNPVKGSAIYSKLETKQDDLSTCSLVVDEYGNLIFDDNGNEIYILNGRIYHDYGNTDKIHFINSNYQDIDFDDIIIEGDSRLTDARTPTSHNHSISDVTSLQTSLNNKADTSDVPTKTSDLTNDGSDGSDTYVESGDLSTVATSGDYNNLSNKPSIPTDVSDLTDTENTPFTPKSHTHDDRYYTESEIDSALNNKADTNDIPSYTSDLVNDGADGNNPFVSDDDSRLTNARTPTSHSHSISDVTNLQSTLTNKVNEDDLLDLIYPIGAIYISANPSDIVCPIQLILGGTWERIQDMFLLASTDQQGVGTTGGSADAVVVEHTHTQDRHRHMENNYYSSGTGSTGAYTYSQNRSAQRVYTDYQQPTINPTGESGVGKNMPPYLMVNIWKRVPDP